VAHIWRFSAAIASAFGQYLRFVTFRATLTRDWSTTPLQDKYQHFPVMEAESHEQRALIQKLSAELELNKAAPQTVLSDQ
jgi:hypothetical protein